MSQELHKYIRQAKENGARHEDIKMSLVGAGWHPSAVEAAINKHGGRHEDIYPAPAEQHAPDSPPTASTAFSGRPQTPVPVVYSYSARGAEYVLMLISLAISATALGALLHSIAGELFDDPGTNIFADGVMSFAGSAFVVGLPLFIYFFLRLKKAELANPKLRLDASRRRVVQIALFASFLIGVFSLISYVYTFFNSSDNLYSTDTSLGLTIADMIITLGIAGGIFAYFWMDSQQENQ